MKQKRLVGLIAIGVPKSMLGGPMEYRCEVMYTFLIKVIY